MIRANLRGLPGWSKSSGGSNLNRGLHQQHCGLSFGENIVKFVKVKLVLNIYFNMIYNLYICRDLISAEKLRMRILVSLL